MPKSLKSFIIFLSLLTIGCSGDDNDACSAIDRVQLTPTGCYLEATCLGELMTLACFATQSSTPSGTRHYYSFSCGSKESPWQASRTYPVGSSAQNCCTASGFSTGCGLALPSGFRDKAGADDGGPFDTGTRDAADAADGP